MKYRKRILFKFWPFVGLAVIVLAFLWRGVSMEGVFFGADEIASDLLHYSYPHKEYFANEYLKNGKILLWNSYFSSGSPVLAQAETGIFNPISILLYYFLPIAVAFNWLIISSFVLTAFGTYLYAKAIGLNSVSSFYSAIVFTLSFFMIAHLRHVPLISSVAFMPFMFWAVEKMLEKYEQRKKYSFLWSFVLAMFIVLSLFGGHLSTAYLILFVLVVYVLIRLWLKYKQDGKMPIGLALLFVFAVVEGCLLASIQLVPTIELLPYSTRGEFGYIQAVNIDYHLEFLMMFLSPYILGDPSRGTWSFDPSISFWENVGYVGMLPLVLSVFGLLFGLLRKHKLISLLLTLLILVILLTLGQNTFLYKFFWDFFPGFNILRIPGRFLLFADFILAILAGFAIQYLYQKLKGKVRIISICILIFFTLADLFYFGLEFNTVMPLSYFTEPKSIQFLRSDNSLFRISSPNYSGLWKKAIRDSHGWRNELSSYFAQREIIPSDMNVFYRIPSSSSLYSESGHFAVARPTELDFSILYSQSTQLNPRLATLLGMQNVKYIFLQGPLTKNIGLDLAKTISTDKPGFTIYIYKNTKFIPRAYFVGKATYFEKTEKLLDKMFLGNFDPAKEVLLEENTKKNTNDGKGKVMIRKYEDEKVIIDIDASSPGYLVLSDTYYPGWNAYIDGKQTKIYRANYAYRAIYVDKGIHHVRFSYEPQSVRTGKILSLLGLIILLVIPTMFIVRKYLF